MKALKHLVSALQTIVLGAACILLAALLLPRVFGITPYVVLSGSMEPQLPVGSAVYVKQIDATSLSVGDVATFTRSDGATVTHQVYEIDTASQTIGTQGIANKNSDGSIMHDAEKTPFSNVIGTPVLCVPYLGYVIAYCTTLPGLAVVIAAVLLLFAAGALLGGDDREHAGKHSR